MERPQTHSKTIGYLLWIFGFTGAHRFYFGRPVTGTIWLLTGGLFVVGWLVDLFPWMERAAAQRYATGRIDYSVAWILQTFLGPLGIHRFYMGKIWTGVLWLLTGGLFLVGYLYDYCTLNGQIDEINSGDPEHLSKAPAALAAG
jgi:TM2 domain-containing membrane protein YozV